jgi:ppGpp synthetase/RelA/SpoT-type nucleotidyltranferase
VKKAGRTLRRYGRGEVPSGDEVDSAISVVQAFRRAHATPLVTANNGLRSMVKTEGCRVEVTQRLKRFITILDKLKREPTLDLSKMQDIGGVRAVVGSIEEIRRVERRLTKVRPVRGNSDYITSPRESGYRGVHVIVEYGGRQIEVQLRTPAMHAWALAVEQQSSRTGSNLKQDGSHPLQLLMAEISKAVACEEIGEPVPREVLDEIDRLRTLAIPHLRRT